MKPERWQQVERLYHAALEQEPNARAAFLAEACAGDETLRQEVDSLLGFDGRAENFIETLALEVAARIYAPDEERVERRQDRPRAVERIGPYKILRELGRGGMGVVYLAERDDEYRKQVAIKLIKRGMDSEAIIYRFRTERQILARLEHPNIARLLDGGTTEDGLPYFVMEYIEGLPIDEYADQHKLTITERLHLFLQVCAAIQHSHQHLVVHRDIKLSNIIVTVDGNAKLLDFGIAKLVAPETGVAETLSAHGWMTPEYSSPEQLRGESITTANDVYSLGVVLYKLLTGRSPYQFDSRSPGEMVEAILNSHPDRPSTAAVRALSTNGRSDTQREASADTISETREGTPEKLRRRLSGDLDTMVLKAMHRDKDLRYSSAAELAEDIHRHLEGHPVAARKDTLSYRTWKFIGRNRAAVIVGVFLVLALAGGILATLWQARRAKVQRDLAVAAQHNAERRFNDVRKLAHSFMFDYHDAIRDLPGSTPIRERLVKDALEYLNSLAEEAAGDPSLQVELADAYGRVSDVQGGMAYANLGDTVGAIESARRCLQIREALLASDPNDLNYLSITAGAYDRLARLLGETSDTSGTLDNYQKSMAMYETLVERAPTNDDYRFKLANSLADLGGILSYQGEWNRSIEKQQQAMQIYEQLLGKDSQNRAYRRAKAVCHKILGEALLHISEITGAEEQARQAIRLLAELTEEDPASTDYRRLLSTSYFSLGHVQINQNRMTQALESYQKSAALAEALAAGDAKNVTFRLDAATAQLRVGDMLSELDRDNEAVAYYRRSLAVREEMASADPTNIWKRWVFIEGGARMALALAYVNDRAGALEQCQKVLALVEATDESAEIAQYRNARALTYTRVADTYGVFAREEKIPLRERLPYWQMTRRFYQKSIDIWLAMKSAGTFGTTQESTFESVKRLIKDCDAAIAKGGK